MDGDVQKPDHLPVTATIPPGMREQIRFCVDSSFSRKYYRIDGLIRIGVRFRENFCYLALFLEPAVHRPACTLQYGKPEEEFIEDMRNTPTPLCRLRYLPGGVWSLALYNFCKDIYEPSRFQSGSSEGTIEEGLDTAMNFYYPE